MIITEEIKVKINKRNIDYYKDKGYLVKIKDEINILVEDLQKGSHINIKCKCEKCEDEKIMWYKQYNQCTSNGIEKYYCNKCKYIKIKYTNLLKYGVDNVMNITENIDKMKSTNLLRYGHECSLHNDIVKQKKNDSFIINDSINKGKKTRIKTCISKFGCENVFQNKNIREKQKSTCLSKFGFENASQNSDVKEKVKNTMLRLYGIPHPSCNPYLFRKHIKSQEELSEMIKYRRNVIKITNKIKKQLFENWKGFDYYDNSYIYDNLKLKYTDKHYPSIDHKISIFMDL